MTLAERTEGFDPSNLTEIRHALIEAASGDLNPLLALCSENARPKLRQLDSAPGRALKKPEPGIYLVGHSALLVRGKETGLLIDPIFASERARGSNTLGLEELRPWVDTVVLTPWPLRPLSSAHPLALGRQALRGASSSPSFGGHRRSRSALGRFCFANHGARLERPPDEHRRSHPGGVTFLRGTVSHRRMPPGGSKLG